MDNMLSIRWQKKEFNLFENSDEKQIDYLFKGIRCSEDVAFKLSYVLGQIIGLKGFSFQVEDEEGAGSAWIEIDDGLVDEICAGSEVEDTNLISENISHVQE